MVANFDLLMLMILISILSIGYISGATVELIKLVKIVIPFLVVYFFGGFLSRIVFKSNFYKHMSEISFIKRLPYLNSMVLMISTILIFLVAYLILTYLFKTSQKSVKLEAIAYKMGKYHKSLGVVLAGIRFYIVASVLIIPLTLLTITSKNDDFVTHLVLEYPPAFTRAGKVFNESDQIIYTLRTLSYFYEVMDLETLNEDYLIINSLNSKIIEFESTMINRYEMIRSNGGFSEAELDFGPDILKAFLDDPDGWINETDSESLKIELRELDRMIRPYQGLIEWVMEKDLSMALTDGVVNQFKQDYQVVITNTTDELMSNRLMRAMQYIIIKEWLRQPSGLNMEITHPQGVITEATIEKIFAQLVVEMDSDEGVLKDLKTLKQVELNKKLIHIEQFVVKYNTTYRNKMNGLTLELPFTSKLIASLLVDIPLMNLLKQSPLISMSMIDSIDYIHSHDLLKFTEDTIYQFLIKIIVPLYLVETEAKDPNQVIPIDALKMSQFLEEVEMYIDQVMFTKAFSDHLFMALVTAPYKDETTGLIVPYIEYLVDSNVITEEAFLVLQSHALLKDNQVFQEHLDAVMKRGGTGDV